MKFLFAKSVVELYTNYFFAALRITRTKTFLLLAIEITVRNLFFVLLEANENLNGLRWR